MAQVLSEYFSNNLKEKATVQQKEHLFEVLWEGKLVGTYSTEQEAENVAENYALGSQISRT